MNLIEMMKYLLLAIVQGITEVLPISSSGHLLIVSTLLGIDTSGLTLLILLHFGSLVALVIYYFKDLLSIVKSLFCFIFKKNREEQTLFYCRLFLLLLVASIPAAIVGILFGDFIDATLSSLWFVFGFLSVTGVLMLLTRFFKGEKELKNLKWYQALGIGLCQGVGVLPGISRSGSTIFGARLLGVKKEDAAHFAFLMFLPVSAGSFLFEMLSFDFASQTSETLLLSGIGIIVAGVTTYFALRSILHVIKKGKLHYFAYYCFAISIIGLIILGILTAQGAHF